MLQRLARLLPRRRRGEIDRAEVKRSLCYHSPRRHEPERPGLLALLRRHPARERRRLPRAPPLGIWRRIKIRPKTDESKMSARPLQAEAEALLMEDAALLKLAYVCLCCLDQKEQE